MTKATTDKGVNIVPKVTLTERQKDFNRLGYNLKLLQGGRTKDEMAELLGCSRSTYERRMKKPEDLTYAEIKRLCDFMRVDMQNFVCGQLRIW